MSRLPQGFPAALPRRFDARTPSSEQPAVIGRLLA
jgi:hypothetical protein